MKLVLNDYIDYLLSISKVHIKNDKVLIYYSDESMSRPGRASLKDGGVLVFFSFLSEGWQFFVLRYLVASLNYIVVLLCCLLYSVCNFVQLEIAFNIPGAHVPKICCDLRLKTSNFFQVQLFRTHGWHRKDKEIKYSCIF